MANWSPSSIFFGPGSLNFLLGAGFGYLSHLLRTDANSTYSSRISALSSAPTLPLSSLYLHPLPPSPGQLVFLKNGFVSPLSHPLFSSSGRPAVLLKASSYTDQPHDFNRLFSGTRADKLSTVPFALAENLDGTGLRVAVVGAHENHLPLELDWSAKSPLDPPVSLTKTVTRPTLFLFKWIEKSTSFRVSMVTEETVLGVGTRLENVFGRLDRDDGGGLVIQPCPLFPEKCFTMSRSEMVEMAESEAVAVRGLSYLAAFLSLEFFLTGMLDRFYFTK